MKRIAMCLWMITGIAAGAGCNKPSDESCKKALLNMERLLGTDNLNKVGDIEGEIRRCRGGSSKEAVECAAAADSTEALKACHFYQTGEK